MRKKPNLWKTYFLIYLTGPDRTPHRPRAKTRVLEVSFMHPENPQNKFAEGSRSLRWQLGF